MIKAIVGLGNIGDEYQNTYHNVGAYVARLLGIRAGREKDIELLIYPISGFMNESGGSVSRWLKMNNIGPDEFVVAHDDSDLPIGAYKLVRGGGSAGHKGVENVIAHLKIDDFWRLRIGVRNPREISKAGLPAEAPRAKAGEFVLERWQKSDQEKFNKVAEAVLAAVIALP